MPAAATGQAFEPNDTADQASGPLVGAQDYTAARETANDVDFYYFNTSGQRQVDIAVTGLNTSCGSFGDSRMSLLDFTGGTELAPRASINWSSTTGPATNHILYSSPSKRQFLLKVTGLTGCQYRFRIDPASALTIDSPGITAVLDPTREADDAQVLTLNGQRVGASGSTAQTFDLGKLPSPERAVRA